MMSLKRWESSIGSEHIMQQKTLNKSKYIVNGNGQNYENTWNGRQGKYKLSSQRKQYWDILVHVALHFFVKIEQIFFLWVWTPVACIKLFNICLSDLQATFKHLVWWFKYDNLSLRRQQSMKVDWPFCTWFEETSASSGRHLQLDPVYQWISMSIKRVNICIMHQWKTAMHS